MAGTRAPGLGAGDVAPLGLGSFGGARAGSPAKPALPGEGARPGPTPRGEAPRGRGRDSPMMEMGFRAKRSRPQMPTYLLRQPADQSRTTYSVPKNTTRTISCGDGGRGRELAVWPRHLHGEPQQQPACVPACAAHRTGQRPHGGHREAWHFQAQGHVHALGPVRSQDPEKHDVRGPQGDVRPPATAPRSPHMA